MPSEIIQWFPGHMAKTRRLISENIKHVDLVLEILDARIPESSRNPEIKRLTAGKPTLLLLNKASLADPAQSRIWQNALSEGNTKCLLIDCVSGDGMNKIAPAIRELMSEKLARYREKGMVRNLRAMVLGIPNVGKSSLINKISGNKKAKVENRPGVTVDKQWVKTPYRLELLDMPGVLWPKFEDHVVAENLALTGAIKDNILDVEELACVLCSRLASIDPDSFFARYSLPEELREEASGYDLLEAVGRKRGFLVKGGEVNTERTALMLLDELRGCKIGRISLERPRRNPARAQESQETQET